MHVASCGVLHLLQGTIKVPAVIFVVPCDVDDLAGERLVGPLDAPGLLVDVACKHNHVDRRIERWQVAGTELEMEV